MPTRIESKIGTPREECILRSLFASVGLLLLGICSVAASGQNEQKAAHFVGSNACQKCHAEQFNGWKQTPRANVVRDPRSHPEAVLGDFIHPDPARSFTLEDVAFVYGSR